MVARRAATPRTIALVAAGCLAAACVHVERPPGGLPFVQAAPEALAGIWADTAVVVAPAEPGTNTARVSLSRRLGLPPATLADAAAEPPGVEIRVLADTLVASRGRGEVRYRLSSGRSSAEGFTASRLGPSPTRGPDSPLVGLASETLQIGLSSDGSLRLETQGRAVGLVYLLIPVYFRTHEVAWFGRQDARP